MGGADDDDVVPGDHRSPQPPADTVDRAATFHNVARALLGTVVDAPRIGPYHVLQRIGAGGMGVVWTAFDSELDRRIAIKVLHRGDRDDAAAIARLVAEARALAKLRHPNVVTIYGAGSDDNGVWLAMEYVEGDDLAGWLASGRRQWSDVLAVLLQAGRGLAAAHDAGIVHRDFKPHNVLVGRDGQVRVADFGVARARENAADTLPIVAAASRTSETELQTVGLVGTPAYVAPEQVDGVLPRPFADQFAFAVSSWEALVGALPFEGKTMIELQAAKRDGRIVAPPRECPVPRRVLRVLERAMAPHPGERHPDMDALLEALARAGGLTRPPWLLPLVGSAAVALALSAYALGRARPPEPTEELGCDGFAGRFAGIWDDDRRIALREALVDPKASWSETSADATIAALDHDRASWVEVMTRACNAHRTGEISDAMLDFRSSCLERHVFALDGTVAALIEAGRARAEAAPALIEALGDPQTCDAVATDVAIRARPSDPAERAEGQAIVNEVALRHPRTSIMRAPTEAELVDLEALIARAERSGDANARAEVWRFAGLRLPDAARAEVMMRRAVLDAIRARNDELAFLASYGLVQRMAGRGRYDDALRETDLAEAFNDRLRSWGGDTPRFARLAAIHAAELENMRGVIVDARGDSRAALVHYRRAIDMLVVHQEGSELSLMRMRNNMGEALRKAGLGEAALGEYDAALAIARAKLPDGHPEQVAIVNNRGGAAIEIGEWEAGDADLRAVVRDAKGEDLGVALAYVNLAILDLERARIGPARREVEDSLRMLIAIHGSDGVFVQVAQYVLAGVERREGRFDAASERLASVWRTLEPRLGAKHPIMGEVLGERARLARARGELPAAEADARAALDLFAATGQGNPAGLADLRAELAEIALARGRSDDALVEVGLGFATLGASASRHPVRARLLTLAGEAHLAMGRLDAARRALTLAGELERGRDLGELPHRTADALARLDARDAATPR